MATSQNDPDAIRRQMAQIRRELRLDVQQVVAGAEAVTDWRRPVRMYPLAAVGLVAVAGYLVVPKRRRSVPRDLARNSDADALPSIPEKEPERSERTVVGSLVGAAIGTLAPMAWRVAQSYALGYLEQWIAQQQQRSMAEAGPPPPPPPGMPPSASPRPQAKP